LEKKALASNTNTNSNNNNGFFDNIVDSPQLVGPLSLMNGYSSHNLNQLQNFSLNIQNTDFHMNNLSNINNIDEQNNVNNSNSNFSNQNNLNNLNENMDSNFNPNNSNQNPNSEKKIMIIYCCKKKV